MPLEGPQPGSEERVRQDADGAELQEGRRVPDEPDGDGGAWRSRRVSALP